MGSNSRQTRSIKVLALSAFGKVGIEATRNTKGLDVDRVDCVLFVLVWLLEMMGLSKFDVPSLPLPLSPMEFPFKSLSVRIFAFLFLVGIVSWFVV